MEKENNTTTIEIDLGSLNIINRALRSLTHKLSDEIELLEGYNGYPIKGTSELLETYYNLYRKANETQRMISDKQFELLMK
jgi:hypothetical protein